MSLQTGFIAPPSNAEGTLRCGDLALDGEVTPLRAILDSGGELLLRGDG